MDECDELKLLREVVVAVESLRDAQRVGSISLVQRDERRVDAALAALSAWRIRSSPNTPADIPGERS